MSDVYVRLGYEFNIASRAFNAIGVDTQDLGNVPELLRGILEETLSQEASQQSLDRFLPRIRDIIINLLHGLKKKQQRLRQRSPRDGVSGPGLERRQGSFGSNTGVGGDNEPTKLPGPRSNLARQASNDIAVDDSDLPPRTSSVPGRSNRNEQQMNTRGNRSAGSSKETNMLDMSILTSPTQDLESTSPYPLDDQMPGAPTQSGPSGYAELPPPPIPPEKQQDALATLQRSGELERRASRRFSAYQIQKHLGAPNGIPMIPPPQNSPIPNRGRDVRESMNAVRNRSSFVNTRTKSSNRLVGGMSPNRRDEFSPRISEETEPEVEKNQTEENAEANKMVDATTNGASITEKKKTGLELTDMGPIGSGLMSDPAILAGITTPKSISKTEPPKRSNSRKAKSTSPTTQQFIPEQSPQPGKELTLFLQYKSQIKKFVLVDGYNELTRARLQLAFIEKFNWNTHNNGLELPEIYIQDPVSGVRHELEDLSDIKDRSVLALHVEALDEVKRHFDDGIGGLRKMMETLKTTVDDQQSALLRVSDRQKDAAKEIASIAALPSLNSRISMLSVPTSPTGGASAGPSGPNYFPTDSITQLNEVQSLRRDLAVMRQTFSSFTSDIEANVANIRTKAASVKTIAIKASIPTLKGDTGRAYVNAGKKTLNDDSEKIVNRVDDLQDIVEDLRKDVVTRGVRPLPRQLETVGRDISVATAEVKKLQDYLKREKPIWTKIWETELQTVCEERDMLTMQEELAADLQDDLEKATQTFSLVEQATKQQNVQPNSRNQGAKELRGVALDQAVDPRKAKDGVLGEVRALQPNHESRLEAIERAEKARIKELESRRGGEFQKELGAFVEEGKLKKSGGVEETERLRLAKDERIRKEVWDRQQERARAAAEREAAREAAKAAARANEAAGGGENGDGAGDGQANGG